MSLLGSVRRGPDLKPPRIVVYGSHGIGKSSLAAHAPDPILIDIEGGSDEIGVARFPVASSFFDVIEQISALLKDEHGFKTLIVDSADWLEKLVWKETAARLKVKSIEDVPFGKGYLEAENEWRRALRGFDMLREKKGMSIIILAHTAIRRYDDPSSDPYDRNQIALHKAASALVQEWADAVLYYGWKVTTKVSDAGFGRRIVRGKGNGARLIHTEERPAALAKNRYSMPDVIEMPDSPEEAWAHLASHIPFFSKQVSSNEMQPVEA
ncbi:ATP-binding protein [Acetobacter sacchari]|uniref:ATP-binding protein n=1 Tax=Acetobacter sacchari TaxID=2661687 RepID=A0ABS3M0Y6_9PROT|nr:ATP-binding protein [Acetobacter sacchari]MBO1361803.1 ATP-binding protein [Acetobacter sacchari]